MSGPNHLPHSAQSSRGHVNAPEHFPALGRGYIGRSAESASRGILLGPWVDQRSFPRSFEAVWGFLSSKKMVAAVETERVKLRPVRRGPRRVGRRLSRPAGTAGERDQKARAV